MATAGFVFLVIAFAAAALSVIGLLAGQLALRGAGGREGADAGVATSTSGNTTAISRFGRLGVVLTFLALLVCCAIIVVCFFTGDVSILYVLQERSLSTGSLAWLYKLAGLWAGRAGSLLFWVFLIAAFNFVIVLHTHRVGAKPLDNMALLVSQIVVLVFAGVLLFSADNMPFTPTPERFFTADGQLTAAASLYSMNQLLEHWAMAIHPPTLFVGYAGFTVPFAYAVGTLIVNDSSKLWVERATRYVLFSWLFLGAGIGLGAVWAYVVLGWGGYWGWDPVENASLLSWLVGVALIHTFTVYRQRGAFKRWGVVCACLAFTFVIVATFITRSGIVQSVHAFEGDPVSLALFGGLIVVSLVVAFVGIVLRWKSFAADTEGADDVENMLSKDAAYYFNNVIMILFTLVLTYMTVASALPSWLPFGGNSLATTAYEAIARPLGVVYLLILAVCPLLAWGKTDPAKFFRQARIPAACAVVLFAALAFWWHTELVPVYDAMLAKGDAAAQTLLEAGPPAYYNGLALVALLVASLLFFNALFMLVRLLKSPGKRFSAIGGTIAHLGMSIILVGLVGSNMYVYEQSGYLKVDSETDLPTGDYIVREYTLRYADESIIDLSAESNVVIYEVDFDVFKHGDYVGRISPQVQVSMATQQQKLNAAVVGFPEEDLFVVYRGVNSNGDFSMDVRINQFITLVWIGFGLLLLGTVVALVGKRGARRTADGAADASPTQAGASA